MKESVGSTRHEHHCHHGVEKGSGGTKSAWGLGGEAGGAGSAGSFQKPVGETGPGKSLVLWVPGSALNQGARGQDTLHPGGRYRHAGKSQRAEGDRSPGPCKPAGAAQGGGPGTIQRPPWEGEQGELCCGPEGPWLSQHFLSSSSSTSIWVLALLRGRDGPSGAISHSFCDPPGTVVGAQAHIS